MAQTLRIVEISGAHCQRCVCNAPTLVALPRADNIHMADAHRWVETEPGLQVKIRIQ